MRFSISSAPAPAAFGDKDANERPLGIRHCNNRIVTSAQRAIAAVSCVSAGVEPDGSGKSDRPRKQCKVRRRQMW